MTQAKKNINSGISINMTGAVDIPHNGIVVIGKRIGVAQTAASLGQTYALVVEGVFDLPGKSGEAIGVGEPVFWDEANGYVTKTDTGVIAGWCTRPKEAASTSAWVKIN